MSPVRTLPAFTLIEIMIALALMATGMVAIVGAMGNQMTMRRSTDQGRAAAIVAESILQAIQSSSWDDLNDRSKPEAWLTWTRLVDPENNGIADDDEWLGDIESLAPFGLPMDASGTTPESRRVLPQRIADDGTVVPLRSRLSGLRVYLEYYRAFTATDTNGAQIAGPDGRQMLGGLLQAFFQPQDSYRILAQILSEDRDNNGILNVSSEDANGNGVLDPGEDQNGNGTIESLDEDADGDGQIDVREPFTPQSFGGVGIVDQTTGMNRLPILVSPGAYTDLRLAADQSIAQQAGVRFGPSDPVAVRIVITWEDPTRQGPPATTYLQRQATVPRRFYETTTLRRK